MGKKIFWGTAIGGVIAWIWMAISWSVFPWHCSVLHQFENEAMVATVVKENTTHSGVYVLPTICNDDGVSRDDEGFEEGPVIMAAVQRYGANFGSFLPYFMSLLLLWIGAFFIFLVLLQARRLHYGSKVAMSTLIGIIIGILGHFPAWIWWGFSFPFVFVELCDSAVAWFAAGLFMAALARGTPPKNDPPPPPVKKDEKRPFWELP